MTGAEVVETVELVETFDGPPDEIWPIVSDPDLLCEWFADEVELTLEVGAPLRTRDGDVTRVGVVDDVQVGRRLAFTWMPSAPDGGPATTVELEIEADGDDHTVLRVREHVVRAIDFDFPNGSEFRALARC